MPTTSILPHTRGYLPGTGGFCSYQNPLDNENHSQFYGTITEPSLQVPH